MVYGTILRISKNGGVVDGVFFGKKLKEAHKNQDIDAIDSAMNELNTVFQAASQEMYNQGAQGGAQGADFQDANVNNPYSGQVGNDDDKKSGDDDIQDVDYEEVK